MGKFLAHAVIVCSEIIPHESETDSDRRVGKKLAHPTTAIRYYASSFSISPAISPGAVCGA